MELYTVDRLGTLVEGGLCSLIKPNKVAPPFLADHVEELFPEGLSRHGKQYFIDSGAKVLDAEPLLELLFEQVRRAAYPERPSRLQSMFGVGSLDDARRLQARLGYGAIYRVMAEVVFRGDINLLNASNSTLVTSWFAHQYWKGEVGLGEPFWEFVLKCPVRIFDRVE